MFTYISYFLVKNGIFLLNPVKYITLRFGGAIATSFILMLLIMPKGIKKLKSIQKEGQPIRTLGPESHLAKQGTPTMGGIFIVFSVILSSILWCDLTEYKIWAVLLIMILFCTLGFLDDYRKLKYKSSTGMRAKHKFGLEILISAIVIGVLYHIFPSEVNGNLYFPIVKFILPLGILYILFASIVITGASNAVNLTDGLDGLVSMPIFLTSFTFAVIAYLCGNANYSQYLHMFHVPGAGELAIICGAIMGSCLGFLWFNSKPADIFMGDTGSLSLGAALGAISVVTKHEILLFVVGFIFVLEAISVILQVGYFKLSGGKRIFLMAPLHHHYEKKGLSETKVVARFWIMSFIFAIIGLAMIKIK